MNDTLVKKLLDACWNGMELNGEPEKEIRLEDFKESNIGG